MIHSKELAISKPNIILESSLFKYEMNHLNKTTQNKTILGPKANMPLKKWNYSYKVMTSVNLLKNRKTRSACLDLSKF